MDRIQDWRNEMSGHGQPRAASSSSASYVPPARPVDVLDLTGSSVSSGSPIQFRPPPQVTRPPSKHPAPTFYNNLGVSRPFVQPLKPANMVQAGSSGNSNGGISVKERAFTAMRDEYKVKGIPIQTPVNPPYKIPAFVPQPPPAAFHQSQHKEKVVIDSDDDDEDVLDDAAAEREAQRLDFSGGEKDAEKALMKLIGGTMDIGEIDEDEGPPEGLDDKFKPFPHQMMGLHWLKHREIGPKPKNDGKKKRAKKPKGGGGILADDMGLGKTLQMILLILANKASRKKDEDGVRPPKTTLVSALSRSCPSSSFLCPYPPFLARPQIVTPMSLMKQWESEIEKFTDGSLSVLCHYGPSRTENHRKLEKYDVVLTTYGVVESEWTDPNPRKKKGQAAAKGSGSDDDDDDDSVFVPKKKATSKVSALAEANFYRIILDEAHAIKNRLGKTHKACCALTGFHRWALTGTPIQNNVTDLYALFDFLGAIVKPLNDYPTFKIKIGDVIKRRPKVAMARLIVVLKSIMLRRTKTMQINGKPLLVLPAREIIEVKGPFLDEEEKKFYQAVETKMQLAVNAFIKSGSLNSNYTSVLTLLLRMRQACSHPSLVTGHSIDDIDALEPAVKNATDTPASAEDDLDALIGGLDALKVAEKVCAPKVAEKVCALCPKKVATGSSYCQGCDDDLRSFGKLQFSTKVKRCMKILEDIKTNEKGKKTIVFSQFTMMFDVLEPFLKSAGYKYVRFDGKLNSTQREVALEKIRNDKSVTIILISIKCGSVGLNLTCCSRVVLLDLWWNPQIENQAFDRAHRMGQKDDVKIFKITVDHTIEDRILTLQKSKAELANAALEGGELGKSAKLTQQDILFLFRGDGGERD